MKKCLLPALVFSFFLNAGAAASMVSFYVIETGLPENRLNNEHSVQWENAFMDVFFDAGHIISNFPTMRFETRPQGEVMQYASISMMEARNWGIEYIVIAQLDYVDVYQSPASITFFVYKVHTNEKLFERQIAGKTYRSIRDEYEDLKVIVRSLVPIING